MRRKLGVVGWAGIIALVSIVLTVLIMLFGPLIAEGVSPAIWSTIVNLYPAINFIGGIAFLVFIIGGIYRLFTRSSQDSNKKPQPTVVKHTAPESVGSQKENAQVDLNMEATKKEPSEKKLILDDQKELYELADRLGLVIVEEKHGIAVIEDGKQIHFSFSVEELMDFIKNYQT